MTNFAVNKMPQERADLEDFGVAEDPFSAAVSDRAQALAAASGIEPAETREAAARGDLIEIMKASGSVDPRLDEIVRQMVDQQTQDADYLLTAAEEATNKAKTSSRMEDYMVEKGIIVPGQEYTSSDLKYALNLQTAEQLFRDKIDAVTKDTNVAGYIGGFADRYILRYFPIGLYEDITGRSERKGRELLQAAITMEPDEYKTFISSYIEELSAEGVFDNDNYFALLEGFDEALNAGYDPMREFNFVAGIAEVIPMVGGTAKAVRSGKGLAKARRALEAADSTAGRVAALEGQEAGGEVAAAIMKNSDVVDPEVTAKAGAAAFDPGGSARVRPLSSKMMEVLTENTIVRKARELDIKGALGRLARPEATAAKALRIAEQVAERTSNPLNNWTINYDTGNNPILRVDFGKVKDGAPYKNKGAAAAAARKAGPEYKAQPVDELDESKGWVVSTEEAIDVTGLNKAVDLEQVEYGFVREQLARWFGSNAALDDEYLTALANLAEAGETSIAEFSRPFEKALQRIPKNSKTAISRVYKELRDGVDAELKDGYTDEEFKLRFKKAHPRNKDATEKDMEAYRALVTLEDAEWFFRANETLIKYIARGFKSLDIPEGRVIGRPIPREKTPVDADIFDVQLGTRHTLDDLPEELPIYQLEQPLKDGKTQYIVNPKSVDVLDHAEVFGFNSGGRRVNPKANYFAVFDDAVNPRAFLTAFSEKEVKTAVREISAIQKAIKEGADNVDDIVRANNTWNPDITTADEFKALAKRKKWDTAKNVSWKERGATVAKEPEAGDAFVMPLEGSEWGTYVRSQLHRYNDVLMDFGGKEAYNVDPVNAILDEFTSAAAHYTHRAYTYNSAAAWVKRAQATGGNVKFNPSYSPNDYINQVQHAEVLGRSTEARRLAHMQSIIRRRLKMNSPLEQQFESFGQAMREFVFEKTGAKFGPVSVENKLLNVGFQSAFGFFNASQFFMQGMHAVTIAAISPKYGPKAAAMVIPLRAAIHAGDPEATAAAIKRLAKFTGDSEEDMMELVEYMRTSGRHIIDGDTMELGTGPQRGVSGYQGESYLPSALSNTLQKATAGGKAVLDMGLMPFRAGERLGRMTGISTAVMEWRAKNPGKSILTDEARTWITTREQRLSFNMTAAGRAAFQSGPMKVPTQWMSYTFRAMESVFLGRGFEPWERARMGLALMPMFGLTGMGLGWSAEWATETFGIERPEFYIGLKYGFLDYLVAEFTPFETALATRLAPVTGITDLFSKITSGQNTPLEVLLGPSGEITGGIMSQFWETATELFNGHTVSFTEDALQILRQPSGLDNIAKGVGILVNGHYRSKNGTTLPTEMKTSDALISFMGFSPAEVNEFYARKTTKFFSDRKVRKFGKEMNKDFGRAIEIYQENPDRGRAMLKEIEVKIALSPLSVAQKSDLKRNLMTGNYNQLQALMKDLYKRDKNFSANILSKTLGDSDR